MAKFLNMWRMNPMTMTADPAAMMKAMEMGWTMVDKAMENGRVLEFGFFPDGLKGYAILAGEAKDIYETTTAYLPQIISDVHEIIPYETGKKSITEMWKARLEMMKR